MEKSGEKSQYFTAFNSLDHQTPLQISKGDLELKKGILKNQPFPLNSYPKVICMVYSKQISALNIMIIINRVGLLSKSKRVILNFLSLSLLNSVVPNLF
jgi:hypothetical protein